MKDEQNIDGERRKKVENFHVHIDEDNPADDTPDTVISSYSDPKEGEKNRERSKNAAASRAQIAHALRNEEKARKNKSFFRLMWFSFVLMASLLAAKYLVGGVNDMLAIGRQPVNVTVEIPKNATSAQVTQILYKIGAMLPAARARIKLLVPYPEGGITGLVRQYGAITSEEYCPEGIEISGEIDEDKKHLVSRYLI